jgi:FkbM family methyltransferase
MARRPRLVELAGSLQQPLVLADVGVRWGFEPRWTALAPAARLIGFDADADECAALRRRHAHLPRVEFAPVALSDRAGTQTLHVTREPAASSLLEPDPEVLRRRRGMRAMRPAGTMEIQTETLEAWAERSRVDRIDVLKLDVQGAELAVLRGAGALVAGVRALDLEVEFNPIYRGQPLFADIDAFLRERGFALWRLGELTHYGLPGAGNAGTVTERQTFADGALRHRVGGGQLVWGRARYARVADRTPTDPWPEHVRDACVAWAFQLDDIAVAALRRAAAAHPPAEAALAQLERTAERRSRWRTSAQRDWAGAAVRLARVAALNARGFDDEQIARELRLTVANVRLLRRTLPWERD